MAHQARRLIARMPGKWHMVIIAALQARPWAAFNMVRRRRLNPCPAVLYMFTGTLYCVCPRVEDPIHIM